MTGAGSGGLDPPDGSDAEEAERCPICLSVLAGGELAMPDSCCHVFCLRCLLTWAEVQASPSCPVDRRPFSNICRWDGNLRLVQVPVRNRLIRAEAESCQNPEQKNSQKNKVARRSRRPKRERGTAAKTKGLVRKCSDEEPSSLSRKKVRGPECCTWAPTFSVATPSQNIADPVWLAEDAPHDTGSLQCKPRTLHCPWLSAPTASVTADGSTSASFHQTTWNSRLFPPRFISPSFCSTSALHPSHFIFQGVVCAVTRPKGGEKRGGRSSTSKAPTKEQQVAPSRRSGRNSKSQEEPSSPGPASPPQSVPSDSDSSGSQPSRSGKASQVPARRKGRRVTNRKASGKRKTPTGKKAAPEMAKSEEEEEEGEEEGNSSEEEEQGEDVNPEPELQRSNTEEKQHGFSSSEEQGGAESALSDTQEHPGEGGEENGSQDSDSPPNSPLCSEGVQEDEEEEEEEEEEMAASPASSEGKSLEKRSPMPPSCSPEIDDEMSPQQDLMEEEVKQGMEEVKQKDTSEEGRPGSQPASPSAGKEEQKDPESSVKVSASEDSGVSSAEGGAKDDGTVPHVSPLLKEDGASEDDTNVVPMDCSSPASEQGNASVELPADSSSLPAAEPQAAKEDQQEQKSQETSNGKRRSRFHSSTSTWSPQRENRKSSRSRSRERDGGSSRVRSRDDDREHSRRERSRERSRERRRPRHRSRSRSRSRTRSYRRAPSPDRPASREHSPQRKDRRGGWRSGPGGEARRFGGSGRYENGVPAHDSPDRSSENPDWVTERSRAKAETRSWESGSHWEDHRNEEEPRGRGARGGFDRGRSSGWSGRNFGGQQEEPVENRWQPRNNSGNNSGNDAYSRFNRKKDCDAADSVLDRSGWSSASSWAVRRTLPADVQDYYSKKERGGGAGGWNRVEEEQQPAAAADPPKSDAAPQAVPGNAPVPVMTMIAPQPAQISVLHYPLQSLQGALPVSLQPAAPYAVPPQVPVHLHPGVPLLQVPAMGAQGLPPPPPPPPPIQAGSQTTTAQPDGHTMQMAATVVGFGKAALVPTPTKGGAAASHVLPSSTTQASQHSRAQADSSKKEKKQQIQEKAINEVKMAIKPFYQKKEITKEEYKEIVRKAVDKVCHSKSGEVNSGKVANLVKAYVDKYKHARKK